jgi:peptidoglycan/xylan/chitin deacetylase (PgdA/CDA1 family)
MDSCQVSSANKIFRLASGVLYYSRALKILDYLSTRFEPKKKKLEGKIDFPYVRRKKFKSIQILLYHRVNDEGDRMFPAVPTAQFAAQMEYVAEHCSPCSLDEAVERLHRNDLPENALVVTFDDGYRDNYVHAFPVLQRNRIPATIFLATGAIGTGRMIWHDRVFRAFRESKVAMLDGLAGIESNMPLRTIDERRSAQGRILQLLWQLPDDARLERIDQLEERLGIGGGKEQPDLMLGWDEVSHMAENGILFGSHTVSHPILANLPESRLRDEVEASKKAIECRTNRMVTGFAYPVGRRQDFDEGVKRIVREAGYGYAVTTIFGVNEAGQDPFELRRGTPWEADIPSFATKLSWYKFVANG